MSVTRVKQSAVISQPHDALWAKVLAMDFTWWNIVQRAESAGCPQAVNNTIKLTFRDGAAWTIRVTTLSCEEKVLEFEVLESTPDYHCSAAVHHIQLHEVTMTKQTLFVWRTDFSSDVTANAIEDSKFKKLEAFAALLR